MHSKLNPRFSIITVTYNAEKVIEETIQSVITQTYKNYEYIIIDGASKDNTLSVIDKYKDMISRVVSEPDKGLYDAMHQSLRFSPITIKRSFKESFSILVSRRVQPFFLYFFKSKWLHTKCINKPQTKSIFKNHTQFLLFKIITNLITY